MSSEFQVNGTNNDTTLMSAGSSTVSCLPEPICVPDSSF